MRTRRLQSTTCCRTAPCVPPDNCVWEPPWHLTGIATSPAANAVRVRGVMKGYRGHWKICGDTDWLRELWGPAVRRSIAVPWHPTT